VLLKLRAAHPDHRDYLVGLTQTCTDLGQITASLAPDLAEAQGYFRESVEAGRRAFELYPKDFFVLNQLMRVYITRINSIAVRDATQADLNDIAEYDRLSTIAFKRNPNSPRRFSNLSYVRGAEGTVHYLKGNYEQARRPYEEALGYQEKWAAANPLDAGVQRTLFISHSHVADVYNQLDGPGSERAGKHYLRMIEIAERLTADPNDRTSKSTLATGLSRYAGFKAAAGDHAAALPYAERALTILKSLVGPQSEVSVGQSQVLAMLQMGDIQRGLNRPGDAARYWREAFAAGESLVERFDRDAPTLSHIARAAMRLARGAAGDEAASLARKSLGYAERAAAGSSPTWKHRLTHARGDAALIFANSGNTSLQAEARALAEQSAAAIDQIPATQLKSEWPEPDRDKVRALARASN
jgi:tetratricopeptide (TPR) repeat protein